MTPALFASTIQNESNNSDDPSSKKHSNLSSLSWSPENLETINSELSNWDPKDTLKWALSVWTNLHQTTSFGPTGLVILDMWSKIISTKDEDIISFIPPLNQTSDSIPLIFIDTLYHFPETIQFSNHIENQYPINLHRYKPENCDDNQDFEGKYGLQLWETNPDMYDYLVKVEPARRAYKELNVQAVVTGRRRSQKGARNEIGIIEIDSSGLVKINPLAYWSFDQVWNYIKTNKVITFLFLLI